MNPSKPLVLAAALTFLAASSYAQKPGADDKPKAATEAAKASRKRTKTELQTREKRKEKIVKIAAGIDSFCETADAWKITRTDPQTSAMGAASRAAGEEAKAKAADADMGNWKESARQSLRDRVKQIRGQCSSLRSQQGLIPLLAENAWLEEIPEGTWDHVTEKLDEVLLLYKGSNSNKGESRTDHYGNFYQNKGWKNADRINQLTLLAVNQLVEVVDNAELKKAGDKVRND